MAKALRRELGVREVTSYTKLLSSDRNEVARLAVLDADGHRQSWVVKVPLASPWGVREEAALRTTTAAGVRAAVELVGVLNDPLALILPDLGTGPMLADRLLGPSHRLAREALQAWAGTLGALHAQTAGLQEPFLSHLTELSPLGTPPADTMIDRLAAVTAQLPGFLDRFDLPKEVVTPAVGELEAIAVRLGPHESGAMQALSPGDTCPSNAIETDRGYVLLDFEEASYRHVAWDAAYLRVPWPTCWCSWRLPEEDASRALARWRDALGVHESADVAHLDGDVTAAAAAWSFVSLVELGAAAVDGDPRSLDPYLRASTPTRRAMLHHRMRRLADDVNAPYPALRGLAPLVADALARLWGLHPLTLAPAFRNLD